MGTSIDTISQAESTSRNIDWVSIISLLISIIALGFSIYVERRNKKISAITGRPFIKVDYRTFNQFPQENVERRFHITAFVRNESGFKIKINNIVLSTNGNMINDLHIPLVNPWFEHNEERDYSWVIEFPANTFMQNTLNLIIENEANQIYNASFDFSGLNEGTAYHDKLESN